MLTTLVIVIVALISFVAGRATATSAPKRDKRGRFVKRKPFAWPKPPTASAVRASMRAPLTREQVIEAVRALGPQHAVVLGAVALGIILALAVPPALAPFTALAPLPLGVAWGVSIITPKKSNQSWAHLPLSAGWDPSTIMLDDWLEPA